MSDVVATRVDRSLFSLHPEVEEVEVPLHRHQVEYLETNLRVELPDRFVAGNMGVYWVPGQLQKPWVGPDVLVGSRPARDPKPRVYIVWEDGPIQFVAEVASDRTRRSERKKREQYYRIDLQILEYLYIDLDRHELELRRLEEGEYRLVAADSGRLYSQELNVWFGWDAVQDLVRIWTANGRMLLTKEEDLQARQDAEQAQQASERARQASEQVLQEAEQRAHEAEIRAAELGAELERLRRVSGDSSPDASP